MRTKKEIDLLRKIQPGTPQSLSPREIRFLDRISGRKTDAQIEGYSKSTMTKLFSSGYLEFGTLNDNIKHLDMPTLRKLSKAKGLKAGGKKVDIAQRILDNYSIEELNTLHIPEVFVLTDAGQHLLEQNSALILYYAYFGSCEWTDPKQIMKAQKAHSNAQGEDILICLLKKEIEKADRVGKKRYLTAFLCRMYELKDDTVLVQEAKAEIQRLDAEWEKEHQRDKEKTAALFGLSVEAMEAIEAKARAEIDEDYIKKLDDENRRKAGL